MASAVLLPNFPLLIHPPAGRGAAPMEMGPGLSREPWLDSVLQLPLLLLHEAALPGLICEILMWEAQHDRTC